jgi:uncharacterized membrane protein YkvA (DUF1232 family)
MAIARWAALRSLANAIRLAVKPGGPSLGERLSSLPRLVRATFRGDYTGTTRGRLLLVAGAVLYVISPVDALPEVLLPIVGLADDAVVLSGIAAWLVNETESYLAWERATGRRGAARGDGTSSGPQDSPHHASPGPQDSPRYSRGYSPQDSPAASETVHGRVVP